VTSWIVQLIVITEPEELRLHIDWKAGGRLPVGAGISFFTGLSRPAQGLNQPPNQ